MAGEEYGAFKHGGTSFAMDAGSPNSLLRDADPFVFAALDFFTAMLTKYVGPRLLAAAAASTAPITEAVASAIPYPLANALTQGQYKFPLLSVHRMRETLANRTVHWRHSVTMCQVAYVLPPLDNAQMELFWPILSAVGRVFDNRCEWGADPDYTPPFTGAATGSSVWKAGGIEQVGFVSATFGSWEAADGLVFPSYVAELEVRERVMEPDAGVFPPLADVLGDVDLKTAGEANVVDFVQTDTNTT